MGNFWEESEIKRDEVIKNISQINEITKTLVFVKKMKVYLVFELDDDSLMKRNSRKIIKVNIYDYNPKKMEAYMRIKPKSLTIENFYKYFNLLMNSRSIFLKEQMKNNISKEKTKTAKEKEEEDDESGLCPICNENNVNISLPCNHFFCEKCIKTWLLKSESCPLCRIKLKLNKKSPSGVAGAQAWNIIDDIDKDQLEKEYEQSLKKLTKQLFFE